MRLRKAVAAAVTDPTDPAAVLALAYARSIDRATQVPATIADALDTLRHAAADADAVNENSDASRALRHVAGVIGAAAVLDKLGPKLLVALDVLLVTPKAILGVTGRLNRPAPVAEEPSDLDKLRERNGTRSSRAAG